MRKFTTIFLILGIVLTLVLSACGESTPVPTTTQTATKTQTATTTQIATTTQTVTATETAYPKVKLVFSGGATATHQLSLTQKMFAEEVTKRSNGQVTVEPYYAGELFNIGGSADAVSMGAVDMTFTAWSHWGERNAALNISEYSGMCLNGDEYDQVRGEVVPAVSSLLEEYGVKVIFTSAFGSDGIISRKPLATPADAAGQLIRCPTAPYMKCVEALGATPAQIQLAEVYDALAKGAIDATFSSYTSIIGRKYIEVATHILAPTSYVEWLNLMNLDTWNSLSPQTQQLIMEVGEECSNFCKEYTPKAENEAAAQLKDKATITELNRSNVGPWLAKWQTAYDGYLQECKDKGVGDDAQMLYNIFQKISN